MNPRSFIPGIIILLIGVGILLGNFGYLRIDWDFIWRLWPLLLILAGVLMLFSNRRTAWLGVVVVLLALIGFAWAWQETDGRFFRNLVANREASEQIFTEEYAGVSARAKFTLDAGAGDFRITNSTTKLVEATTSSTLNTFSLERSEENGVTVLNLTQAGEFRGFSLHKAQNKAEVSLNESPLWEFDLSTGAAQLDADLSRYKVDRLRLSAGAANIILKLGSQQTESRVEVSTGAASVTVKVPESVGCEIIANTGLTGRDFDGFVKEGNQYRTPNFEAAAKKVFITFETGLSSVRVERY